MLANLVSGAPWWAKIGAKIVLSRVPLGYSAWSALGLFRHGGNAQAEYSFRVFEDHHARAQPQPGFVSLEMGPGDAVASAILTKAFGGSRSIQVDVGSFADRRLAPYQQLSAYCIERGLKPPNISDCGSLEEILRTCDAEYLTNGLSSLRSIPAQSVDFIYSQSCLEHISLGEFDETLRETRRILKPGGVASHWIDLQDHFNEALNNLRFSEKTWESPTMSGAGFYTNRLRHAEIVDRFTKAGFTCEVSLVKRWDSLPTDRSRLNAHFSKMPDEELLIRGFNLLAR